MVYCLKAEEGVRQVFICDHIVSRDELTAYRKKLKDTLRTLREREEIIGDAIDEIDYLLELEE